MELEVKQKKEHETDSLLVKITAMQTMQNTNIDKEMKWNVRNTKMNRKWDHKIQETWLKGPVISDNMMMIT